MGELLIVLAVVALAAVWLGRRYWRAAKQEGSACGCGGSCGCGGESCCSGSEPRDSLNSLYKER